MANQTTNSQSEILLGIDHGDKNIGLAFGRLGLVAPLMILSNMDDVTAVTQISRVCKENKVTKIIIGLPLDANGKDTLQSKKVRHFAKVLRIYVKLPQEFVNEINSTVESFEEAFLYGVSDKTGTRIDHVSAAMILKKYLRENA